MSKRPEISKRVICQVKLSLEIFSNGKLIAGGSPYYEIFRLQKLGTTLYYERRDISEKNLVTTENEEQ